MFADFVHAVQRHGAATRKVPKEDHRKFSMATPQSISHVVQRLWHISFITEKRILQDHDEIWVNTLFEVLKNNGEMIPHLGDRRTGRRGNMAPKFGGRGGCRTKDVFKRDRSSCFHDDALYGLGLMKEKSNQRYNGSLAALAESEVSIILEDDQGFDVFNEDEDEEEELL
jgi:hypothetical protein